MSIPRADPEAKEFLRSVLPADERITLRPMFGNVSAFVNGNMFAGVFGTLVFLRLDPEGREELLDLHGASVFSPLPGRLSRQYVTLPEAWRDDPARAEAWVARSFEWAVSLPPRQGKPPAPRSVRR